MLRVLLRAKTRRDRRDRAKVAAREVNDGGLKLN